MVDSGARTVNDLDAPESKLTVIHAFQDWLPTTQSWMYNQVRHLPDDIDVHIVCDRTSNLDEFGMPNIHHPGRSRFSRSLEGRLRSSGWAGWPRLLRRVISNTHGQLVHSHFGPTGVQNLSLVKRSGAKHVVTFYGYDVTEWPHENPGRLAKYQELFARVDRVFCEGPVMAEAVAALGCEREKVTVHRLGIPLARLPYRPRLWSRDEPLRVLMAASFREKKGIPYGIEALGRISDQVELEVTIIGDAPNNLPGSEEKARILQAIADARLTDRVKLTGFQPYGVTLETGYGHHILLAPSVVAESGDTEGGAPVIITEMAASGMPIVSSFHCDIPEVVLDGKTGWLAPEKDVDALAAHLRWLIEHPGEWITYLDAGRAHIESKFDCVKQGERLADQYRRLADSPVS